MTAKESKILRELIDKNWECTHEPDTMKKFELAKQVSNLRSELKTSMGAEEFDKFMFNGRKMFAPKED